MVIAWDICFLFIRCVATACAVDAATVITVDDIPFHRYHLLYHTK